MSKSYIGLQGRVIVPHERATEAQRSNETPVACRRRSESAWCERPCGWFPFRGSRIRLTVGGNRLMQAKHPPLIFSLNEPPMQPRPRPAAHWSPPRVCTRVSDKRVRVREIGPSVGATITMLTDSTASVSLSLGTVGEEPLTQWCAHEGCAHRARHDPANDTGDDGYRNATDRSHAASGTTNTVVSAHGARRR